MVWRLCTHGRGVDIVEGVAGSGKTYALAAANQAWTTAGVRVIGCSLAAKAASGLQTDAGIASTTIDRMLIDVERPDGGGFSPNTVVVVDEAAMVGTRKLLRLLDHAAACNAKVVLVGDPCQLPEIEAGGGFVGLAERLRATPLMQNRRQHEAWERRALAQLRAGGTDSALDTYLDQGRVTLAATGTEARERMINDRDAARANETTVMLAARVDDVHQLNAAARH